MRLQAELQANPANTGLQALLADLLALPGIPATDHRCAAPPTMQVPVLTLKLQIGGVRLELFSMVCTFGTALDLTADELRLELLFPCDEVTARFLRADFQVPAVANPPVPRENRVGREPAMGPLRPSL